MVFAPQNLQARPRLLLVYADSAYAARIARNFRRLGWEVHMAPGLIEASRLAEIYQPQAVVLEARLSSERSDVVRSLASRPGQHVVLLADQLPQSPAEVLSLSGASALVARNDGLEPLVRAVYATGLARAV